jgi:hypothetical protein
MPVTGSIHRQSPLPEQFDIAIQDGNNLVSAGNRKTPPGTEIILHILND